MMPRLPAFLADHPRSPSTWAFVGGPVFDGSSSVDETTVLVRNGVIAGIGDAPPRHAHVIDLEGRLLMPGLIDAHAHLSMLEHAREGVAAAKGAEPVRAAVAGHLVARTVRRALDHGVTTVRDVGAYGPVLLEIRQAVRYRAFAAPRLLLCARIVSATCPGARFFPGMYREADGADDMRRAVREQIRDGADFVKIMSTGARSVELEDPHPSQVTREEMAAFVDEAHRQGYRAAAHCEGLEGTGLAIEEGCDTIEHGFHLHRRPDLLQAMARDGQTLVPTLDFLHHVAESGTWVGILQEQGQGNVESAAATLRAARAAGVPIALGSDSPNPNGVGVELGRLVEHGLSPIEALAAGTGAAARALGIDEVTGTLAPGTLADLAVVDAEALRDPGILARPDGVWLVMRNGDPVGGTRLAPTALG